MNINVALEAIAVYLKLDSNKLKEYARADAIGGFDFVLSERKWPLGSIWGVEGQVLYALVRATQPFRIAEIGHHHGCSASHMSAALKVNGANTLIECVDIVFYGDVLPDSLDEYQERVISDGISWLESQSDNSIHFLFEDDAHSEEMTFAVWQLAKQKLAPGGLIVTHDSEHFLVGQAIRDGVRRAGITDFLSLLIEPSDCGLAIWQKPAAPVRTQTPIEPMQETIPPVKPKGKPRSKGKAK